MTKEEVKKIIQEEKISFIQCWFTDLLGNLRSFTITPTEIDEALEEGMGFDGSSILGYTPIYKSDMIAMPDPDTFQILPWKSEETKTARLFCDILNPDQTPYEGDPRFILKRALKKAAEKGYTFYVGPELEFFYFRSADAPLPQDKGVYFDGAPFDLGEEIREKTVKTLQKMGIRVEYAHHEVAPGQHEIDLRYDKALAMADKVMTYKLVVKEIARQNELFATFMPKPLAKENGSGMHTHQSLFQEEKNVFFQGDDQWRLSATGKSYIAGILKHAPEITLLCNPCVNSYKRLTPGYEAPVYLAWARRNRSALIRVPMYKPDKEAATRLELRSPDPSCNPYLAFAAMLTAGLKGIEENYELPAPQEENIFAMDKEKLAQEGIKSLPATLAEAIYLAKNSELITEILGENIKEKFLGFKEKEWDDYRTYVGRFDWERYSSL